MNIEGPNHEKHEMRFTLGHNSCINRLDWTYSDSDYIYSDSNWWPADCQVCAGDSIRISVFPVRLRGEPKRDRQMTRGTVGERAPKLGPSSFG